MPRILHKGIAYHICRRDALDPAEGNTLNPAEGIPWSLQKEFLGYCRRECLFIYFPLAPLAS